MYLGDKYLLSKSHLESKTPFLVDIIECNCHFGGSQNKKTKKNLDFLTEVVYVCSRNQT